MFSPMSGFTPYRNLVLALWEKDTSRMLQLTDCKVTPTATPGESSGAPLIREVFEFLDRRGFINCGIAGSKRALARKRGAALEMGTASVKVEAVAMTVDFLEAPDDAEGEKKEDVIKAETAPAHIKKEIGSVVGETEAADSGIAKGEAQEAKHESIASTPPANSAEAKDSPGVEVLLDKEVIRGLRALLRVADLQTMTERQLRKQLEAKLGAELTDRKKLLRVHIEAFLRTGQVEDDTDDEDLGLRRVKEEPEEPVLKAEAGMDAAVSVEEENLVQETGGKKAKKEVVPRRKRVIVVGAGPAGLTAARHMQRLGLEVSGWEWMMVGRFMDRLWLEFHPTPRLGASDVDALNNHVQPEHGCAVNFWLRHPRQPSLTTITCNAPFLWRVCFS
jgi:hypothetical protein